MKLKWMKMIPYKSRSPLLQAPKKQINSEKFWLTINNNKIIKRNKTSV